MPHTDIPADAALPVPNPGKLPANTALKIVVLGALSMIKGADVLEDVATLSARNGALLDFHLLGYAYRSLKTRPQANLTVHGQYAEADLPRLLSELKPDLVWFPAQWPETYSYTLSAALQQGLPVVTTDLGAFSERLGSRLWSWVRPWNTPVSEWVSFFDDLREQHFVAGHPPPPLTPPSPTSGLAQTNAWSYEEDYLSGVGKPFPPSPEAIAYLVSRYVDRDEYPKSLQQTFKRQLLLSIVRLRSAKGLRRVARTIPLRWQTRVKSWLLA